MATPVMYVYFDDKYDIKGITPALDQALIDKTGTTPTSMPLAVVEGFLTGRLSMLDHTVRKDIKDGLPVYSILKKVVNTNYTRPLSQYLTEVSKALNPIITITNNISRKMVFIDVMPAYMGAAASSSSETQEAVDAFKIYNHATLYFTALHNPYILRHSYTYSPATLFHLGHLEFSYDIDLSSASVYTKKILDRYEYKEEKDTHGI